MDMLRIMISKQHLQARAFMSRTNFNRGSASPNFSFRVIHDASKLLVHHLFFKPHAVALLDLAQGFVLFKVVFKTTVQ